MALVRISNKLLDDSARHITDLKNKELNSRQKPAGVGTALTTPIPAELTESIWALAPELKDVIPKGWLRWVSGLAVQLHLEWPHTDGTTRKSSLNVSFENPTHVPFGTESTYTNNGHTIPKAATVTLRTGDEHLGVFKDIYDYCTWRSDVEYRWREVQTKVRAYLVNCRSFNEAVKLWPEVAGFVPDFYAREVAREVTKPVRAPKAVEETPITEEDRQTAMASLTISRLSQ